MANKPNIRFKGFTEEWRNSAFGIEVTSMPYKKYVKSPEPLGMYPIIQQGDNPICGYANGEPILDYEDKIIFGDHTTSVYKPITPFFAATDGIRIFSIKGLPPFFTYSLFERYKPKSIGYARHTLLLLETRISIPVEQKEAENIGDYFKKLNSTITQREKELEKLKNIKRALLEKLFPQNGENVPALRFKEFTEEWGEKKLKDIAIRITRKNVNLESSLPLCISAQLGLVSQTEYYNNTVVGTNIADYFLIRKGEFAYNKSAAAEYPLGAVKCLEKHEMGILSTLYIIFALKQNIDKEYIKAHYDTKPWQYDVKKRIAVGARNHGLLNISPEDFFDSLVIAPSDIIEQKKIGKLFSRLDHLLSLREKQLTLLKHTKQALLEQMFVNE